VRTQGYRVRTKALTLRLLPMMQTPLAVFVLLCSLLFPACLSQGGHAASGSQLVHNVYFTLRDDTDEARAALVADCYASLSRLPGIRFFSAGARDERIDGGANDRDFDVALLVVFEDRAAHARYVEDPAHKAFIEAHAPNWQVVRVFDSLAR